jgi:hypothetical protein
MFVFTQGNTSLVGVKQHPIFLFFLLVIVLLDVWDILVEEQPSSEEWHIAIRSLFE